MKNRTITTRAPLIYFLIAIGFSWLFWIPAAFVDENILESPWVILLYIGGLGPAIGGILLTYLNDDKESRKEYWRRVIDVRRISAKWYLAILLAYPLITALLAIVENGQLQVTETFRELLTQPARVIIFAIYIFIFGPLPEELGWRGYALDGLQNRMNAVLASLLLGAVWALWHIPLFFMKGTYQNELGFGSAAFWRFMVFATVVSIFFTWIYNNNQRSTLSAALFHFSINFTGNILEASEEMDLHRIILFVVAALIVVLFYGANDLAKKPKETLAA
jgi:membrane protease YdiL (CAAX protease family)